MVLSFLFLKRRKYHAKHHYRASFDLKQDVHILVGVPAGRHSQLGPTLATFHSLNDLNLLPLSSTQVLLDSMLVVVSSCCFATKDSTRIFGKESPRSAGRKLKFPASRYLRKACFRELAFHWFAAYR